MDCPVLDVPPATFVGFTAGYTLPAAVTDPGSDDTAVAEAEFGGELPGDFDVLVSLPGIGRKTANLLVATVFGRPGLVVDTHFIRLSNRLGFVKNETDATKI